MGDDDTGEDATTAPELEKLKKKLLAQQLDMEPKKLKSEMTKTWIAAVGSLVTAALVPIALTMYEGYAKRQQDAKAVADKALDVDRENARQQADIVQKDKDGKHALVTTLAPLVLGKTGDRANCPLVIETWKELYPDDPVAAFRTACDPPDATPPPAPAKEEWGVLVASSPSQALMCDDVKVIAASVPKVLVYHAKTSGYVLVAAGYVARTQAEQDAVVLRRKFGPGIVQRIERLLADSEIVNCTH